MNGLRGASAPRIPRILHRVWVGGAPVPVEYEQYWDTWRANHPTWQLRTWTDADLPRLVNQKEFDAASTPAARADIARYELLLRYGGVYVDCDFESLKPLDGLLEGVSAFSASEDGQLVSIGIMGAVPAHPWIWRIVTSIPSSIAAHPGARPNVTTGPVLATRATTAAAPAQRPHVFPPATFYPYHYTEPERRDETFPDAHAVHHWAASWK